MSAIKKLIVLSSLLILCACGTKPQTSEVHINTAFMIANTSFPAGLILYAEKSDGTKKFSTTLESSNSKTISLEKGTWSLAVVGWKGNGAATLPNFISSAATDMACGVSPTVNLTKDTESVVINVSSANCPTFNSTFRVLPTWITSCGAFYQYNSGSDEYSAITTDTFCSSLPMFLRSSFTHFKIFALDTLENKLGFASECYETGSPAGLLPTLPANKFAFVVKIYESISDCTSNSTRHKTFELKEGLSSSYGFDTDINFGSKTRLALPSTMSNKARSPFMSLIPQILCGAYPSLQDCVQEPSLVADVNVPWQSLNNSSPDKMILKGVSGINTCPVGLISSLNTSIKFSFEGCNVQDDKIKANIYRNGFLCHNANTMPGVLKDIYQRGDYLYVLTYSSPNSFLYVLNRKGKLLSHHNLGSSSFEQIATTSGASPDIFLTSSTSQDIKIFRYTPGVGGGLTNPRVLSSLYGTKLDVKDDGSILFLFSSQLKSYTITNLATSPVPTFGGVQISGDINHIKVANGFLYVLQNGMSIHRLPVGLLPAALPTALFSYGSNYNSFDVNASGSIFLTTANLITRYDAGTTGFTSSTTLTGASDVIIGMTSDWAYIINGTSINAQNYSSGTIQSNFTQSGGICTESRTLTAGGVTKIVDFESRSNDNYPLFNDGYRFTGRRVLTEARASYYFDAFQEGDRDKFRTGGYLSRAQEFLSPENISGMLSDFSTCSDIVTSVTTKGPLTRIHEFKDPLENDSANVTLTVSGANPIDSLVCNDSDTTGSCSARPNYDLKLDAIVTHDGKNENIRIKLSCDAKRGSFETLEVDPVTGKKSSEKVMWNMALTSNARYEYFSLDEDENGELRGDVVRTVKDNNSFFARRLQTTIKGTDTSGSVTEYAKDASNRYLTAHFGIKAPTSTYAGYDANNYIGSFSFANIRSTNNFNNGPFSSYFAPSCVSNLSTLGDSNVGTCTFGTASWNLSRGNRPMALDEMSTDGDLQPTVNLFSAFEFSW